MKEQLQAAGLVPDQKLLDKLARAVLSTTREGPKASNAFMSALTEPKNRSALLAASYNILRVIAETMREEEAREQRKRALSRRVSVPEPVRATQSAVSVAAVRAAADTRDRSADIVYETMVQGRRIGSVRYSELALLEAGSAFDHEVIRNLRARVKPYDPSMVIRDLIKPEELRKIFQAATQTRAKS